MDETTLSDLLAPFLGGLSLTDKQLSQLHSYLDLLLMWNARTNLTAVRDEHSIVSRHFGESLFLARQLFPAGAPQGAHLADVGSGPGFPGLPLKVLLPEIQVTLIESQNKKATFLREVIRKLGLSGASVYLGRAETWDRQADVVTMRAVEHFEKVLPTAASLVRHAGANSALERPNSQQAGSKDGGRLALLIGANQSGQAIEILPDFHWQNPITVPNSESRVVLIGRRD